MRKFVVSILLFICLLIFVSCKGISQYGKYYVYIDYEKTENYIELKEDGTAEVIVDSDKYYGNYTYDDKTIIIVFNSKNGKEIINGSIADGIIITKYDNEDLYFVKDEASGKFEEKRKEWEEEQKEKEEEEEAERIRLALEEDFNSNNIKAEKINNVNDSIINNGYIIYDGNKLLGYSYIADESNQYGHIILLVNIDINNKLAGIHALENGQTGGRDSMIDAYINSFSSGMTAEEVANKEVYSGATFGSNLVKNIIKYVFDYNDNILNKQ